MTEKWSWRKWLDGVSKKQFLIAYLMMCSLAFILGRFAFEDPCERLESTMETLCAEPEREACLEEARACVASGDWDQCEERVLSLGGYDDPGD